MIVPPAADDKTTFGCMRIGRMPSSTAGCVFVVAGNADPLTKVEVTGSDVPYATPAPLIASETTDRFISALAAAEVIVVVPDIVIVGTLVMPPTVVPPLATVIAASWFARPRTAVSVEEFITPVTSPGALTTRMVGAAT